MLYYFLLGILIDVLVTLHYRCVQHQRKPLATGLSIAITIIGSLVIHNGSTLRLIAYGLGCGVGTWIGMTIKVKHD